MFTKPLRALLAGAALLVCALPSWADTVAPRPVKVLIISMFGPEAEPWIKNMALDQKVPVVGLSSDYPNVLCNKDDVCLLTTGMGHANVAASTTAVILSKQFDLRQSYFLIAGIAGIDPAQGTLGSAAWARWLVDFGIAHEIDVREAPKGWKTGYFGVMTNGPGVKPVFDYKTEAFKLDETLLQRVLAITGKAELADNDQARAYRKLYKDKAASAAPRVIQCDTLGGDTWWHGHRLGQHAREWTKLLSDGEGVYCTTQQEDNATYNALLRGQQAGLLDIKRLAVLRTASNFDRPHPGQTAYDSLKAESGGFPIATENLYRVGGLWVKDLVARWPQWQQGVPAQ
ncbi:hypothetical protein [Chitinimonas sp.]|uniref:purine-nucleoside phosphorylase n=1 Tax=Chitinimonas sp. TaxID=1934313 RepID=UPI002F936861